MTQPLLKLGGLSRVTGVPGPTLLRWLDRDTLESSRFDVTTSGSGEYRKYSRPTVNKVAIAWKLTHLGIGAGQAIRAAAQYTDVGGNGRTANEQWEFGRTVLIHTEDGTKIKNLDPDASLRDVLGRPFTPAILIDVGQVIHEVDDKLKEESKNK